MASHDLAVLSLLDDLSDEDFMMEPTPEPVIKTNNKSKKNNKGKQNKKRNSLSSSDKKIKTNKNDKISRKSSDKKTGEKLKRNSKKFKEKPLNDALKQNKNRNSNSPKIVHKKRHSNSSTNSDKNIQKTTGHRESNKMKEKKPKSPSKSGSKLKSKRLSIKTSKENVNIIDIETKQQNIKKLSKSSKKSIERIKTPKASKTPKPSKLIKSASIPKSYTKSAPSTPSKLSKSVKSSKSSKTIKSSIKSNDKSLNKLNKSNKLKIPKSSKSSRPTHLAAKSRKSNELMMIKPNRPRSKSPQPINDDNDDNDDNKTEEEEEEEEEKKEIVRDRSKSPQPIKAAMDKMDKETMHRLYDNYKRKKWKIGSKVEVFSVSQTLWIKGKVIKICNDLQGEWLTIMYSDNCTQKTLQRNDNDIRPITNNNDNSNDKKEKMAKLIGENIKNTKNNKTDNKNDNDTWYIGQKCEIKDAKAGWSWCEILETFQDTKGKFMTIEYKIYDKERRHETAQYKRCHIPMGFKGIKATIPNDISLYLATKWKLLTQRIDDYPIESMEEHMNTRDVQLTSMAQIFNKFNIETYNDIPAMVEQLIDAQNIKLLPILIMDLENTLIPYKLIQSIIYKNNIKSFKQLFINLNHWSYDSDYKYLKELQRILRQTAEIMNVFINNFRGKIMIYNEGGYGIWNNLVNYIPESAGGDLWREIYKKAVVNNNNNAISIYSAKSAYIKEKGGINSDINDIINSKQLILERYLKSIQMEMEYGRLKNETYFVPVIFEIGDDKTDINSSKNAVQQIFKKFYRLIQFHLINNNNNNNNNDLSNHIVKKSLFKCLNNTNIQYFIGNNSNKTFKRETWFGLFSDHNQQYMHQLIT